MILPNYISSDEKRKAFGEKAYRQINTAREFDEWYAKMSSDTALIYRGVKEARYKNYTSAQRKVIIEELPNQRQLIQSELDKLRKSHGELLKEYCSSLGMTCSDLYLLSFAQHYGGVSPLLDFSFNLDKALFFMLDEASAKEGGAKKGSLDNYMSLYSSRYDVELEKQLIKMAEETVANKFKNSKISTEATKILSKTMFSLPILAQMGVTSFLEGMVNRVTESGFSEKKRKYAEIISEELAVPYFDNVFSYATLCSQELPEIQPILIPNKPLWVNVNGESKKSGVMISNLNIVAQEGCFVYYDKDLNPLEYQINCADIHKSLIPYIRLNYLSDLTKDKIYPDPNAIAQSSLFCAQANI